METIAFIGGGNMAGAIIGGLVGAGHPGERIVVVEPGAARRQVLIDTFGVRASAVADVTLADATLVIWAVKPQMFAVAAAPCRAHVGPALHLSVMAGIRSDAIARTVVSERIVRAMPNTPALIGQGIAGLFARPAVTESDRRRVEAVLAATGQTLWVDGEAALDAVTALSGSGPAYVFHLVEAMLEAARLMGLPDDAARRLAVQTVAGSAALVAASSESPAVLRRNVTSPNGTTQAALEVFEARGVKAAVVEAILAARDRAVTLGDELGQGADAAG
ncbi:MAG: pyrroline-5-carboxylate reductase [Caldimonas sp.]